MVSSHFNGGGQITGFLIRKCTGILLGQKSGHTNQVTVWQGSTVIRICHCALCSFTHAIQSVVPVFFLKVIIAIITTFYTKPISVSYLFRINVQNKRNNTRLPNRSQILGC